MPQRTVALLLLTLALAVSIARAWDQQPDGYEVIDGPWPTQDVDDWRRQWTAWRQMELQTVRYDAADKCNVYNMPAAQWTQRGFVQAFVMLHDRDIFDRETNAFTVAKYVAAMEQRVGKLDSVLLWPAYPNSGIDGRNQWDFFRSLPGGLDGLRSLIREFHARDVRVVLPYNPWDTATRDEDGLEDTVRMYGADIQTIQSLVPQLEADGINGDTMYGVPKAFFNCSAPILAAPEGGVPSAYLSHNPMSWGYYYGYSNFPPVARPKFLESRHMVQVCARWSLDKVAEVQAAFFNGVGYVVWENVWSIWIPMTARESEAAKRAFHVLRAFAPFTASPLWRPYAFRSTTDKVYASAFPHPTQNDLVLYTIINAAPEARKVRFPIHPTSVKAYDVFNGRELAIVDGKTVDVELEPRGFGAVLVAASDPSVVMPDFVKYMGTRRTMTSTPLADFADTRELLRQEMTRSKTPSSSTTPTSSFDVDVSGSHRQRRVEETELTGNAGTGMALVKGESGWWFNVTAVQIEPVPAWTPNWAQFGLGVQFPWENRPWKNHSVKLDVRDFYMDRHPVTNQEFHDFLKAAKYKPRDLDRFLEHWTNRMDPQMRTYTSLEKWQIPKGLERSPVVFVSIEDARAYATFYKKRLPHDWEWQYVASNGKKYDRFPWGNDFHAVPLPAVSRDKAPRFPDPIGSFPDSRATSTGVQDLVGLVWQMTDQFCDDHTCGVVLRGGSYYRPIPSTLGDPNWYFPQAYEATQHNKFLQLSESYDRSAFVGFRCARSWNSS
jgi:gamma-glutamyl hercynylcysteine S-oxide synthase